MTDAVTAPAVSMITAVQQKLAQLGYYHGQIDGIAGPVTRIYRHESALPS